MKDDKKRLELLSDLQDEYMEMFGELDYSNVFLEVEEEIATLEKCLDKKVRWKEIVGYDEEDSYEPGGTFM